MKIIIVGCGNVGSTLAEQLNREGHDITIIESRADALETVTNSIDVMGVVGNGAVYQVQMEAGVRDADLLIATTDSDELNMLCCLIAKKAGNCHTIARIRDPQYSAEIGYLKEELNLSLCINPELAAAEEIARLLKVPSAIKVDTFAKGRIELLKLLIPAGSVLDHMKVFEVNTRLKCQVLICTVERGDQVIIPNGGFELLSGDRISFIARTNAYSHFFEQAGIVNNRVQSLMIVGGGRISYYLAKLLKDTGIEIKIIDRREERCEELARELPHCMIIHGDGSDQQLLSEEGISKTEAFAALTGADEENIMISLYASRAGQAKLITKVNRTTFENVIADLKLGSVIYPKVLTADRIQQYVLAMQNSMGSNIETLYHIAGDRAEALEFHVDQPSAVTGIPLGELKLKDNLLVASIARNGKLITPGGRDTIEVDDSVIIVSSGNRLRDLKDILR